MLRNTALHEQLKSRRKTPRNPLALEHQINGKLKCEDVDRHKLAARHFLLINTPLYEANCQTKHRISFIHSNRNIQKLPEPNENEGKYAAYFLQGKTNSVLVPSDSLTRISSHSHGTVDVVFSGKSFGQLITHSFNSPRLTASSSNLSNCKIARYQLWDGLSINSTRCIVE